ncbi:hypothetical protein [Saccharopolyspora pogona]|uniref:hypothetical protein n=1 Tax=Saccharopolyspora pogona TaxID=333966 RepID=UPI0016839520|nr:hypothetical protein [Saccharopolyspora pogona]
MTNQSVREIETLIHDHVIVVEGTYSDGTAYRYEEGGWHYWFYEMSYSDLSEVIEGLGVVSVIETEGGGEGEGDHVHMVFRVVFDDGSVRFFRIDGYYQSYDGTEIDGDLFEVQPVERLVTFYEAIGEN